MCYFSAWCGSNESCISQTGMDLNFKVNRAVFTEFATVLAAACVFCSLVNFMFFLQYSNWFQMRYKQNWSNWRHEMSCKRDRQWCKSAKWCICVRSVIKIPSTTCAKGGVHNWNVIDYIPHKKKFVWSWILQRGSRGSYSESTLWPNKRRKSW